jgi:NhaA family Na+:H+ antiporter
LTALAVMDDLGAIIVIAVFYTAKLSTAYLNRRARGFRRCFASQSLFRRDVANPVSNRRRADVVPDAQIRRSRDDCRSAAGLRDSFSPLEDDVESPSHKLEHFLHKPVAFIILPIFALAIRASSSARALQTLANPNELGIIGGLVIGKPIGITLLSFIAVNRHLPPAARFELAARFRRGLLGGIGFTMSIFITNLAFVGNAERSTPRKWRSCWPR